MRIKLAFMHKTCVNTQTCMRIDSTKLISSQEAGGQQICRQIQVRKRDPRVLPDADEAPRVQVAGRGAAWGACNRTAIWSIWYLDSTQLPPQLQNQQRLKQRKKRFFSWGSLAAVQKCRRIDSQSLTRINFCREAVGGPYLALSPHCCGVSSGVLPSWAVSILSARCVSPVAAGQKSLMLHQDQEKSLLRTESQGFPRDLRVPWDVAERVKA